MHLHLRFSTPALTAALALGIAGTAAGTPSLAPFAPTDVTPEQRVVAGSSVLAATSAPDPTEGRLPWSLRISRSETGLQCSTVGQV
jgi:hypothetical protein